MSEVLVFEVRNSRERLEKSATKTEGKDVRRYQSIELLDKARNTVVWDIDEASQTFLGPFTRGGDQMIF